MDQKRKGAQKTCLEHEWRRHAWPLDQNPQAERAPIETGNEWARGLILKGGARSTFLSEFASNSESASRDDTTGNPTHI